MLQGRGRFRPRPGKQNKNMKRIDKNQIPENTYKSIFSLSHPNSKELFYKSEHDVERFFDKIEEIKRTIDIPSGIVAIEPIDNKGLLIVTFIENKISQKQVDQFVEKLCDDGPHSASRM